jgi:Domain of unknown function (DUF1707)
MYDDITPRAGGRMRVGDAERDRAAAALGEHFSAGRLDQAEFDARVNAALAARTEADLAALFTDLPSEPKPGQQQSAVGRPWPGRYVALPFVLLPIAIVAAVVAVRHGVPPFFLIPLFFWLRARRGPARRTMRRAGPIHY